MKYFAVALLAVFASSTASAAESWKTFFAQTNLAPASNSVFHAEKNLGIYVELNTESSNNNELPKFLASIAFPLPHSAQSEVYNYLAQAKEVSMPRFTVIFNSVASGTEQTQSEIQLVHRFVNEFSSTSGPAFMVWKLGKGADLEKVSQALQEVAQKSGVAVAATYPVPATKAEEIALKRRRLADASVAGFSGPEYVLMCWVLIALVIIAFFVFCCIPWAPELDAGLRSSLKSKAD